MSSSNVEVNYNKKPVVCYFCNKEIHGESESVTSLLFLVYIIQFQGHTAVCGSVLVPCINKCGAYTPRKDSAEHNRKCPNIRRSFNFAESNSHLLPVSSSHSSLYHQDSAFKGSTNTLPLNNSMVSDIRSLHNRCSILEQYLSKLSTFHKNKTFLDSKELQRLTLQNRLLEEWRDIVNLKLENIRQQLIQQEFSKSEAQENWKKLRQYLLVFEKFKIDVSTLRENLVKGQDENNQNNATTCQNLTSLRELADKQNFELVSSLKDHKKSIDKINNSISELQESINLQTAKSIALNFDVKALTRISTEAVEKLEMQEKHIQDMTKELSQMKINLEILEERPDSMNISTGRLLWKITNVEARMRKAKETGIVLQSSIFYTHEFGYKIRPKNFTKSISAKHQKPDEENEDPQESSSTYIFIPHRILLKPPYLKEDTIFLDFHIHRCRELAKETNL